MNFIRGAGIKSVLVATLACAMFAAPAVQAQEAEATRLGEFNYWTALRSTDANGVICYISSEPQSLEPTNVDHGDINFLVIHRKGAGVKNEVQAMMGYDLRSDPLPSSSIDGKNYNMTIQGNAAWLASEEDEPGFVDSMKAGSELVVKATSARGTNTTYTYSLSGVTAAMAAIDEACA